MSDYDDTNRGALFENEEKTADNPNWADLQGSLNVEGTDYYLSAWRKTGKSGKKYWSLGVKPKAVASRQAPRREAPPVDDFDSDLPF